MLSAAIASQGCIVAMVTRCLHRFQEAQAVTCLSKDVLSVPTKPTAPGLLQRREEGMWADLQVRVLSAYMPTVSQEPTTEGRLLPPIYEDVCS